ncbi:hypothetical protein BURMUCF2_B0426 [Burkholderia multivorans CF2]|nr:hypothetical protein BURMUCF2_B0426 [Burkholderia multivorans CF2]
MRTVAKHDSAGGAHGAGSVAMRRCGDVRGMRRPIDIA